MLCPPVGAAKRISGAFGSPCSEVVAGGIQPKRSSSTTDEHAWTRICSLWRSRLALPARQGCSHPRSERGNSRNRNFAADQVRPGQSLEAVPVGGEVQAGKDPAILIMALSLPAGLGHPAYIPRKTAIL